MKQKIIIVPVNEIGKIEIKKILLHLLKRTRIYIKSKLLLRTLGFFIVKIITTLPSEKERKES